MSERSRDRVVALCGGVGGAKLALGLYHLLGDRLTLVVNTGDDFLHLGFRISPDLDTVVYTLAGLNDPEKGWGRGDESWNFMEVLRELDPGQAWFQLGDRDLALHASRTSWLASGGTLASFTDDLRRRLNIGCGIVPMTNDCVGTVVETVSHGSLSFQHYFVRHRCVPVVRRIRFDGASEARPLFLDLLGGEDLRAVIVCPSNPFLSVAPILSLPGVRESLAQAGAPVVAISPIIGGAAVKGPTAKIMAELGLPATSASVARYYEGLIDGLVIDRADAADAAVLPARSHVTGTLMSSLDDRIRLAREALLFCDRLSEELRGQGTGAEPAHAR